MTLDNLLRWGTEAMIVILAVLTTAQLMRQRDRSRLDIALVFGSLAIVLLLESIQAAGARLSWLRRIEVSLLLAHPYLLLRLVQHFRAVSMAIRITALFGMVLSLVMTWFLSDAPGPLVLGLAGYFCWLEGFVTYAFIRGALITGGVTHWRLLHAAAATGMLTVAFGFGVVNVVLPSAMSVTTAPTRLLVALAGLNFSFSFAPPLWLRQVWQYWELHRLTFAAPDVLRDANTNTVLESFCAAAMRAVGGEGAAFLAWNEPAGHLEVRVGRGVIPPPDTAATSGAVARARATGSPQMAQGRSEFGFEEWHSQDRDERQAIYAIPIVTPERAWGVLVVLLRRAALFPGEDLELLAVFCTQAAISLDYLALLRRQRALIEVLDTRSSDLQQANAALTREVQNRKTAEEKLAASNRELEAFSYSVSHDLRAPLRHIGGFAELLQRSPEAATLDDKAKRHLNVIVESVARMGTLIDDLLAFSRAGRVEMHNAHVSLDQLIQDVRAEVTADRRNGQPNWNIHPLPDVQGDPSMLRVAFVNLLSNAVKYTRTRPRPEIEIGCIDHSDETVIFVRDNGVGFDMAYVDKLFGVFQRLHRADEFEGTGIGLANVKRVIVRHGGRVWAEGAVDRGATFYVSLPKAPAKADHDTMAPAS